MPLFSQTLPKDGPFTTAVASLSDFRFDVNGSADAPSLVFTGGTYNFRDPADAAWSSETHPLLVLAGGNGEATGSPSVTFTGGASLRAWDVGLQGGGQGGARLVFDGGSHVVESLGVPNGTVAYANAFANTTEMTLTNGAVLSTTKFVLGLRPNKTARLTLHGSGTRLETREEARFTNGAGISTVDVLDGAELRLLGASHFVMNKGTNVTHVVNARVSAPCDSTVVTIGRTSGAQSAAASCAVFAATNAAVDVAGTLVLDHVAKAVAAGGDTRWCLNKLTLGSSQIDGTCPALTVAGGTVSVTNAGDGLVLGQNGAAAVVVADGVFSVAKYATVGNGSASSGTLTVSGGIYSNAFPNAITYLAKSHANATGALNVSGGAARLSNLYVGWAGRGEVSVSGGLLSILGDLRLGNAGLGETGEHLLTLTGGEISCAKDLERLGVGATAYARLRLNGGRLVCPSLAAGNASAAKGGTGRVALEADGGTLTAASGSAKEYFVTGFDSADIKAGGLTIDTAGLAVNPIDQDFTGTGTLTLMGGGSISFARGRRTKSLRLGNGLTLGLAETLAVDGDLTLDGSLFLTIPDEVAVDATFDAFAVSGEVPAETRTRWADVIVKGKPCEASIVEATDGVRLRLTVRAPKTLAIGVGEGVSEVHATNVAWSAYDTLATTVAAGGELRFKGLLGRGYLVKDGPGVLTLERPESLFYNGVLLKAGTLAFDAETEAEAPWRLALDAAEAGVPLSLRSSRAVGLADFAGGTGTLTTAGEVGLALPDTAKRTLSGHLQVAEGVLAVRGTAADVSQLEICPASAEKAAVSVGLSGAASSGARTAGLVVDHARLSGSLALAAGIAADDPLEEVSVVVTDGGALVSKDSLVSGVKKPALRVSLTLADNSTLTGSLCYNFYCKFVTPPQITARNGSAIYGTVNFREACDFAFDGSTLAADSKGTPAQIAYYANSPYTNSFTFVNGSVCNVGTIGCAIEYLYACPPDIRLTFDDSEWRGMTDFGPRDLHAGKSRNPTVSVLVCGRGLVLDVPEGTTYTWAYPLADAPGKTGGFVKRGVGTLKVLKARNPDLTVADGFAFAHKGQTVVEAGVLDLDGNTWTGGTLGGGEGKIANGTLDRGTVSLDVREATDGAWSAVAVPRFASSVTFGGRTKVDLGEADPPLGATFVIARYEGAAPDVSRWKLVRRGDEKRAILCTAENGEVVARLAKEPGFMLLVR